jgi:hypothetical protein
MTGMPSEKPEAASRRKGKSKMANPVRPTATAAIVNKRWVLGPLSTRKRQHAKETDEADEACNDQPDRSNDSPNFVQQGTLETFRLGDPYCKHRSPEQRV